MLSSRQDREAGQPGTALAPARWFGSSGPCVSPCLGDPLASPSHRERPNCQFQHSLAGGSGVPLMGM